ncbi:hypothetical protein PENTCL1PPCAC_16800, partial [Pristionchus entomophagus]
LLICLLFYTPTKCDRWSRMANFINLGNRITGDFFVPSSFSNHYRNAFELGTGGYGTVIALELIKDSTRGIAVKRFNKPFDSTKQAQRCFRELQLLRELNHENIVKMKFVHTTDRTMQELNSVYLTTEFCGADLNFRLEQETPAKHQYSLQSFQTMISELLRALKYLNSANVIHRDLKPDNLAIDDRGKLTLLDFGIARVIDEHGQMTNDPGTKYYRAIETIAFGHSDQSGCKIYNEKADIWSIGAILCQMITGEILFREKIKSDNPILKALSLCGPIPDCVLVEIDDPASQHYLHTKSQTVVRMDFLKHFREEGRPWLWKEVEKNGAALVDFIDRTLAFDHRARMSVDEALAHPFLAEVRQPRKEVLAGHAILDVRDQTMEKWREYIWISIQNSPVRYDEQVLA